jgi:hypothetical protein
MTGEFVGYIGTADIHDAVVVDVERIDASVRVLLKTAEGKTIAIQFSAVSRMIERNAKGTMLYALCELSSELPVRHFLFKNWDDRSPDPLEIFAASAEVIP